MIYAPLRRLVPVLIAVLLGADAPPPTSGEEADAPKPIDPALAKLRSEAERLEPLVETPAARALLAAVVALPPAEATTIYYRPGGGYLSEAWTKAEHDALEEADRGGLKAVEVDTERYYQTFYGSPLASVRTFDLAARYGGLSTWDGRRVLDFGFGSVGQLRLLAACGADAVGTEVMPMLRAIYAHEGADGPLEGPGGQQGRVTMAFGRWPAEKDVTEKVGTGFDLFVSKNTIKRGYVAPPVEVDPRQRLDFGVEPDEFLRRLLAAMRPGGLVVFYNLGGRPPGEGEPYNPPTDIASPWSKEAYEALGFEVLAIDVDDSTAARQYAHALGWDADGRGMVLERDLFASYTVLRRPGGSQPAIPTDR
jgi:hypothetical protein